VFSLQKLAAIAVGAAIVSMAGARWTASAGNAVSVSTVEYRVPDLILVRDDGKKVSLLEEMDDGRPVFVNFIFTSCPGICPLMSEIFRQLQAKLGDARPRVHMVSISIDPEADTPSRLREYAAQFRAGSQWQHYTGTVEASLAVQRAFGVYNGDKMNHAPVAFFRGAPGGLWIRLDGFATADDLMRIYYKTGPRRTASR
jgi:protein SCO1/2